MPIKRMELNHTKANQPVRVNSKEMTSFAGGCPCGVMVKAMDWEIVAREFELQSRYYVHFRTTTLGKSMNPLSSQLWVK